MFANLSLTKLEHLLSSLFSFVIRKIIMSFFKAFVERKDERNGKNQKHFGRLHEHSIDDWVDCQY